MKYYKVFTMGQFIQYKCNVCGFEYVHDLEVFWIDENFELNVSMLLPSTSTEMFKSLVNGFYHEYFCYGCNRFVREFLISENPSNMSQESIINLIEEYDNSPKIIKFDNKFQNCLSCSDSLKARSIKAFSFDKRGNFEIKDFEFHDFANNDDYDFWGIYYGYYCNDCRKQINKFVVMQNLGNLDEDTIRYVLKKHTNDLTVLIFDYKDNCPNCGSMLETLDDTSVCPKCREGSLRVVESLHFD